VVCALVLAVAGCASSATSNSDAGVSIKNFT